MKWLAFTGACMLALVTLGILAVDERDVVWEGRQPHCAYCRSPLRDLALVCPDCNRSMDWVPHAETCRWCLTRADVEHLTDLFDALELESDEPLPEPLIPFQATYFRAMDEGSCTYCAGLGVVTEAGVESTCPVCRGDKRCIACGGDRRVTVGDPETRNRLRARREERERAQRRAELTHLPLRRALLTDRDVEALRGSVEAEALVDENGRNLLDRARARVAAAFAALHEALREREKTPPAAEDGA